MPHHRFCAGHVGRIVDLNAIVDHQAQCAACRDASFVVVIRLHRRVAVSPLASRDGSLVDHSLSSGVGDGHSHAHAVGIVPPSITYSTPVIDAARGDARKAMRFATSPGVDGRPNGMPPSESMMICLPPS